MQTGESISPSGKYFIISSIRSLTELSVKADFLFPANTLECFKKLILLLVVDYTCTCTCKYTLCRDIFCLYTHVRPFAFTRLSKN